MNGLDLGGLSELDAKVLEIATADMGRGEIGKNNRGRDVQFFRNTAGLSQIFGLGSWCAVWISSVYARACYELDREMPFKPSRSAMGLGKNIAKAGRRIYRPEGVCVIVTGRTGGNHIRLCFGMERGNVAKGLDGNHGRFPSVVSDWRLLPAEWERAKLIAKY